MSNHNAAAYHPKDCGGEANQCCECLYDLMREDRDALKSQLASMTKRAEEAESAHGKSYLRVVTERDAAEAKLATAVEVLKAASVWANSNKVFYHHVGGPGCTGDVLHELGMTALGALRALGIDPSKEQGK